jgi:hypothetical protein
LRRILIHCDLHSSKFSGQLFSFVLCHTNVDNKAMGYARRRNRILTFTILHKINTLMEDSEWETN